MLRGAIPKDMVFPAEWGYDEGTFSMLCGPGLSRRHIFGSDATERLI